MKVKKLIVPFVAGLFALAINFNVWAQNTGALEEIIVTAQKRTESLQEVPISIAVFSEDEI